jgi:hypothetical protein
LFEDIKLKEYLCFSKNYAGTTYLSLLQQAFCKEEIMAGIGILIRTAAKVGGRILGRIAGPLGAVITIGELGYLGLKHSGTLKNFKKLYCDKCRSEIPMQSVTKISSELDVGDIFKVYCQCCRQAHPITKIHLLCPNCRENGKKFLKIEKITAPNHAKYLLLVCPSCNKSIKFARNKAFQK